MQNQSHCTTTEFTTVENIYKPLVLKELRKLWEKEEPDLPWEKGEFNESNTLLLDDSPYKALMNPVSSLIFVFLLLCSKLYFLLLTSIFPPILSLHPCNLFSDAFSDISLFLPVLQHQRLRIR